MVTVWDKDKNPHDYTCDLHCRQENFSRARPLSKRERCHAMATRYKTRSPPPTMGFYPGKPEPVLARYPGRPTDFREHGDLRSGSWRGRDTAPQRAKASPRRRSRKHGPHESAPSWHGLLTAPHTRHNRVGVDAELFDATVLQNQQVRSVILPSGPRGPQFKIRAPRPSSLT